MQLAEKQYHSGYATLTTLDELSLQPDFPQSYGYQDCNKNEHN